MIFVMPGFSTIELFLSEIVVAKPWLVLREALNVFQLLLIKYKEYNGSIYLRAAECGITWFIV
ncbi:MAG: hypothetical protein ABIN67_21420 [Ferruginibacter sp.]